MTITQREKYEWQPLLCDLIPWNATQFCELLGNRTILLVGDSTMHQTGAALASRITWDTGSLKGCADHISIGRINRLGWEPKQTPVIDYVKLAKPDILILNTGAHFMIPVQWEEDLITNFKPLQEAIRQNVEKNVTIVWKTMNPGHVNCSQESGGPLNTDWSHQHSSSDLYQWYIFAHQDRFARHYIQDVLGLQVIDMSPLYYRQDAHSDCLHYCMPGPVDLFSVLLLNMLYTKEL
jgi:hypothetical protein